MRDRPRVLFFRCGRPSGRNWLVLMAYRVPAGRIGRARQSVRRRAGLLRFATPFHRPSCLQSAAADAAGPSWSLRFILCLLVAVPCRRLPPGAASAGSRGVGPLAGYPGQFLVEFPASSWLSAWPCFPVERSLPRGMVSPSGVGLGRRARPNSTLWARAEVVFDRSGRAGRPLGRSAEFRPLRGTAFADGERATPRRHYPCSPLQKLRAGVVTARAVFGRPHLPTGTLAAP
jgi:hypothetical protein